MGGDATDRSPGEARERQIHEAAQRFVTALYSLLRTAAIHDFNNRALDRPCEQAIDALSELFGDDRDEVKVVVVDGQLYLGETRIHVSETIYQLVGELEELFAERGIGSITFDAAVMVDELRRSAYLLQRGRTFTADGGDPNRSMADVLARSGVRNVRVGRPVRAEIDAATDPSSGQAPSRADTTIRYAKAVTALSQLISDPTGRERLHRTLLSRIVQQMTDCAGETIHYLVGLTEFATPAERASRLAVDTCVVAIAVARSMGLERRYIADLGVAALSLGLEEAVPSRTDLSGALVGALRQLGGQPTWSAAALRRTLVVAQRTQPVRSSAGMPEQHPLARIYRAAHDYVALTHGVSLEDGSEIQPLAPLEALYQLSQAPPHVYDALVLGHLVQVVGLYPIGTLVLLNDSRLAFVVARDRIGQPVLLIRHGPGQFGERLPLHATGCAIVGVVTGVDPDERAAAVLGIEDQLRVHDAGRNLSGAPRLGRVQLRHVTVRRTRED